MTLRPSISSAFVFGTLGAVLFLIFAIPALREPQMWLPAALILIGSVLAIVWVTSFRIDVQEGIFRYSSLFRATRSLKLGDICSASVDIGPRGYWDRLKPTVRLTIKAGKQSPPEFLTVNLKPFRGSDVEALLKLLSERGFIQSGPRVSRSSIQDS